VSDLEEDATYESRRICKYQLNQKKLFLWWILEVLSLPMIIYND
jgi:hypothetical protein